MVGMDDKIRRFVETSQYIKQARLCNRVLMENVDEFVSYGGGFRRLPLSFAS